MLATPPRATTHLLATRDMSCSVCMFSNACVAHGRLVLFIPPDIDFYSDDPNDTSSIFSPASFADSRQNMLFSSPNWWESAWTPSVVNPLPNPQVAVTTSLVAGALRNTR